MQCPNDEIGSLVYWFTGRLWQILELFSHSQCTANPLNPPTPNPPSPPSDFIGIPSIGTCQGGKLAGGPMSQLRKSY